MDQHLQQAKLHIRSLLQDPEARSRLVDRTLELLSLQDATEQGSEHDVLTGMALGVVGEAQMSVLLGDSQPDKQVKQDADGVGSAAKHAVLVDFFVELCLRLGFEDSLSGGRQAHPLATLHAAPHSTRLVCHLGPPLRLLQLMA